MSWREPLGAFAAVVVALAALSGLAALWAPLADHILAVAAVVFIAVPFAILRKKGADFHRFGIDLEKIPLRDVGLAAAVTVVVFPLFALGNHFWQTGVENRQFDPSFEHFRQWSVELDAPSLLDGQQPTVQVRTRANRLFIEWSNVESPAPALVVEADRPFAFSHASDVELHRADAPPAANATGEPTAQWRADPHPGAYARLVLSPQRPPGEGEYPRSLRLEFDELEQAVPEVLVGANSQPADEPIELRRTYWWLLIWGLTHLILVALPEEYFYRGYLQTRIGDLFGDTNADEQPTLLGFSRANWITSGFFALGHVLIPVGGSFSLARAAVFFPSLLFGWLRERTGSIVAPTIFHAAANMMVLVVAVHYF